MAEELGGYMPLEAGCRWAAGASGAGRLGRLAEGVKNYWLVGSLPSPSSPSMPFARIAGGCIWREADVRWGTARSLPFLLETVRRKRQDGRVCWVVPGATRQDEILP